VSPGDENENDIRTDAGRITAAAWHLLRMVNDILDHSRIDAQTERAPVEPVEVRHLLAEVEEVMAPQARARGNVLSIATEADVYSVSANPVRLRQCLLNLVGNAIKFTKDGAISVRARTVRQDVRAYVAFDVTDSGIGIAPAVLGRLFAPFVQGDGSIAREYGGAGLGLSIARKLARAMGGDVTVVSEPGKGSTFTLLIPAASALRLVA
jgi:signal transduction histidine kinase